jgi:DnaK suppressor protein
MVESTSSGLDFTKDELETFKAQLIDEKAKIVAKTKAMVESGSISLDRNEMTDEIDLASQTVEQNLAFKMLDRDRKLLGEIEHALKKIETGDFGYCEGTGEPIPKRRLQVRPWCKYSVKYKEQLEKRKKSGRGVADDEELIPRP